MPIPNQFKFGFNFSIFIFTQVLPKIFIKKIGLFSIVLVNNEPKDTPNLDDAFRLDDSVNLVLKIIVCEPFCTIITLAILITSYMLAYFSYECGCFVSRTNFYFYFLPSFLFHLQI